MTGVEVTIGVELEFIVCGLSPDTLNEHYRHVAEALQPLAKKLGTSVFDMKNNPTKCKSLKSAISSFQVHTDNTISVARADARSKDSSQKGVEAATPILRQGQWLWTLPEMTQILSSTFQVKFNPTTGLHVHIGIGRKYTLRELKRISKAIVLFEEQMDEYHPQCWRPYMSTENEPGHNGFILSNRESLALIGLDGNSMISKIEIVSNVHDLLRIICTRSYDSDSFCRYFRYNLTGVLIYDTVEFRQAIGTADGHRIVDWVQRVIKFVTTAIVTLDTIFREWGSFGIMDIEIYHQFGVPAPEGSSFLE